MIDVLNGAFSVLKVRAENIAASLKASDGLPPSGREHCRRVGDRVCRTLSSIDGKLNILGQISAGPIVGSSNKTLVDDVIRQVLKAYRADRREIDVIEENFVGHVMRYNDSDAFFTRLAESLWNETNLPDVPPIAVTNTSGYFCTWAALGIVFSPPSCDHNLLVFPDLYHEFGHVLHQGSKGPIFGPRFRSELSAYIVGLENQIKRSSRPINRSRIVDIGTRWEKSWAEEVACDTLATLMLGPSYGWCNFHLCLQSADTYHIGPEHPSDASRTLHIIRVLRRMKYDADADLLESYWNQYTGLVCHAIGPFYHDYHPEALFTAIMEDVEDAIHNLGIFKSQSTPTIDLFDQAWRSFLAVDVDYNEWERLTVEDIKSRLGAVISVP